MFFSFLTESRSEEENYTTRSQVCLQRASWGAAVVYISGIGGPLTPAYYVLHRRAPDLGPSTIHDQDCRKLLTKPKIT